MERAHPLSRRVGFYSLSSPDHSSGVISPFPYIRHKIEWSQRWTLTAVSGGQSSPIIHESHILQCVQSSSCFWADLVKCNFLYLVNKTDHSQCHTSADFGGQNSLSARDSQILQHVQSWSFFWHNLVNECPYLIYKPCSHRCDRAGLGGQGSTTVQENHSLAWQSSSCFCTHLVQYNFLYRLVHKNVDNVTLQLLLVDRACPLSRSVGFSSTSWSFLCDLVHKFSYLGHKIFS